MLKPQAYITSETFMSPADSRLAAFFMRMLRMKSWGVCPVSSFILRCRCTRLIPTSSAMRSTLSSALFYQLLQLVVAAEFQLQRVVRVDEVDDGTTQNVHVEWLDDIGVGACLQAF